MCESVNCELVNDNFAYFSLLISLWIVNCKLPAVNCSLRTLHSIALVNKRKKRLRRALVLILPQ